MSTGTVIEVLYPEFGNQAGDNGNAMYLRACLPEATFIETPFGAEPAFASRDDISCILLGGMTERQQERVLEALMPWRDRLIELADAGIPMLFTGNAVELLATMIVTPEGRGITALGLFDIVVHRRTPERYASVCVGSFEPGEGAAPFDVVGYKIQFTQAEGDNRRSHFCRLKNGFGLNEASELEGVRRRNLIGTWFLGPLLPINPPLTRWLLDTLGETDAPLAFEDLVARSFEKRVRDFSVPGMEL
ncbi:MAG: glutamine amidotransferase [Coriobacteriaceae bacterium]|nr:glutamine amidotransferase [Coriobacteriaceae bacterium]